MEDLLLSGTHLKFQKSPGDTGDASRSHSSAALYNKLILLDILKWDISDKHMKITVNHTWILLYVELLGPDIKKWYRSSIESHQFILLNSLAAVNILEHSDNVSFQPNSSWVYFRLFIWSDRLLCCFSVSDPRSAQDCSPDHVFCFFFSSVHRAAASSEGRDGDGRRDGHLRVRAVLRGHRGGLVPGGTEDGGQWAGKNLAGKRRNELQKWKINLLYVSQLIVPVEPPSDSHDRTENQFSDQAFQLTHCKKLTW